MWKFYVQRNLFYEAAVVLCTLSRADGYPFVEYIFIIRIQSLGERIEYISLSIANLKSCSTTTHENISLREQEECLEVASIQEEILLHLQAHVLEVASNCELSESDLQALITSLNKNLYSLSDLFNKITRPLKLYEFSLIIIDSAQYKHQASLVISFWTNLLQQELASNANSSTSAIRISLKFTQLGRRFLPSEVAFPVDYLVEWVSKHVYSGSIIVSGSFLASMFSSSGISTDRLLSSFLQLLIDGRTQQMPWKLPAAKLLLCGEVVKFLAISKQSLSMDVFEKIYSIAKESEALCHEKSDDHISEQIKGLMQ